MIRTHLLYKPILTTVFVISLGTWLLQLDSSSPDSRPAKNTRHAVERFIISPFSADDQQYTADRSSAGSMRKVSIDEINNRFRSRTHAQCEDDCSFAYTHCALRTRDDWEYALNEGTVKGVPLYGPDEYIFPWEQDYLSRPPLQDLQSLPSLENSRVYVLQNKRYTIPSDTIVLGGIHEKIFFRLDLVNGYGEARGIGGDEVRAWLSDATGNLTKTRLSASAEVSDLGNGSYDILVTPVWKGLSYLNVAVTYPREYTRAALHHSRSGSHRFIYGLFKRLDVEEVTVCHATPNVPGRSCVCNFTEWNQVSFFCGKPLDKRLSCHDWVSVWPASQPPFKDLTEAEQVLASRMSRPASQSLIRQSIVIEVPIDSDGVFSLTPCTKVSRVDSWRMQSPRGFWSRGPLWTSLMCREPDLTPEWVQRCLRSTQVWLIGDSNMVRIRSALCMLLECVYVPRITKWPDNLHGRNLNNNISVLFRPHEHPLYLRVEWMSLYLNGGIEKYLRSVPSTGRHVVIIHYFLHLSASHLSAFHYRLVRLRNALVELLARNPDVLIGIRGPHISTVQWETNHMFAGDVFTPFMKKMLEDALVGLKERLVYLDGYDMTVSIKNEHFHPSKSVPKAMIRTLLSFKCV